MKNEDIIINENSTPYLNRLMNLLTNKCDLTINEAEELISNVIVEETNFDNLLKFINDTKEKIKFTKS